MSDRRDELVGNRLALIGAVVYLLEWVAIFAAGTTGPVPPGTSSAETVRIYADGADGQALMAGWFSLVLLGRVALAVGVRDAFRRSPRQLPFADLAVGAMVVSVVLEIAGYAVAAGAGTLADQAGDPAAIVALDAAAAWLNLMIFAPIGVFLAAMSWAMLRSGLFPRWQSWVGLVAGVVAMVGGVLNSAGYGTNWMSDLGEGLTGAAGVAFWVWMIAVGVHLFRRAPATRQRNFPGIRDVGLRQDRRSQQGDVHAARDRSARGPRVRLAGRVHRRADSGQWRRRPHDLPATDAAVQPLDYVSQPRDVARDPRAVRPDCGDGDRATPGRRDRSAARHVRRLHASRRRRRRGVP